MRSFPLRFPILAALLCATAAGCAGDGDPGPAPSPVCTIAIAPANQSFDSQGGTGNVTVTVANGCAWTATAGASWVSVTAGSSGTGAGTVVYTVAANAASESRSSTVTVGGQTHAVSQSGRAPTVCTYQIAPQSAAYNKDAATGTFDVTAPASCDWSAVSNASWLTITRGSPGSGNGTVTYAVSRNVDTTERAAAIAVAGRTFSVTQSGDAGACSYSVTPVTFEPCMPAGTVAATLTTQASCPWTVNAGTSWVSVAGASSRTGPGPISISYPDNYDAPRTGVVLVRWPTPTAGQNLQIVQAGCVYAVTRSEIAFASAGGPGTFDVLQQSIPNSCGGATQDRCVWSAVSDVAWITIAGPMPRSGDNRVTFSVAANDGAAPRVGRITVRDKVVVVTQAGR